MNSVQRRNDVEKHTRVREDDGKVVVVDDAHIRLTEPSKAVEP